MSSPCPERTEERSPSASRRTRPADRSVRRQTGQEVYSENFHHRLLHLSEPRPVASRLFLYVFVMRCILAACGPALVSVSLGDWI